MKALIKDINNKDVFEGDKILFTLQTFDRRFDLKGTFKFDEKELRYGISIKDNSNISFLYYENDKKIMFNFKKA